MNRTLLFSAFACLFCGPAFAASLSFQGGEIVFQTEGQPSAVFQQENTAFFIVQGQDEVITSEADKVKPLEIEGGYGLAVPLENQKRFYAQVQQNKITLGEKPAQGLEKQVSFIVLKDQLIVPFGEENSSKPMKMVWKGKTFFVFPTTLPLHNNQQETLGPYVALPTFAGVVTKTATSAKTIVGSHGLAWQEEGYLKSLFSPIENRPQPKKTAEYSATLERLLQAIADVESVGLPSEKKAMVGEEFEMSDSDLADLVRRKQSKREILPTVVSILPRNLGDEGGYLVQQTSMFEALIGARSLEQRDRARFRLAQLSLFYHRPEEALSWLESMEPAEEGQPQPDFLPARFLYGIALVQVGRTGEAVHLFKDEIEGFEDQRKLWLANAYADIGKNAEAIELFAKHISLAAVYPTWMEANLNAAYVRALVAQDKFTEAQNILNDLKKAKLITDEGKMILARIALVRQNEGEAERLYADVSSSDDLEWAYQAQHQFVKLLYGRGELGVEQVIEYYEQLASLWRSSPLEAELLLELAKMYRETDDFKKALARYKTFSVYYPRLPEAKKIPQYMAETFAEVFMPENEDRYDDLALLSLYYDFRELTPAGSKGDQLIGFVGEKLRKMGLLARTIDLYENQLKYRVKEKLRKAEIGNILSRLYRLNLEEDKAIAVLKETFYPGMPVALQQKRSIRLAEAYTQKGEFEPALKALTGINTPQADRVRLNMAWESADYSTLVTMLESQFENNKQEWNPQRQEDFMRLAYAYYHRKRASKLRSLNALYANNLAGSHMQITLNFMLGDLGQEVDSNINSKQPIAKVVKYLAEYNQFLEDYTLQQEERFQERYRRSLFNRRLRQPSAPRTAN